MDFITVRELVNGKLNCYLVNTNKIVVIKRFYMYTHKKY